MQALFKSGDCDICRHIVADTHEKGIKVFAEQVAIMTVVSNAVFHFPLVSKILIANSNHVHVVALVRNIAAALSDNTVSSDPDTERRRHTGVL
jgi:hypothetical protein